VLGVLLPRRGHRAGAVDILNSYFGQKAAGTTPVGVYVAGAAARVSILHSHFEASVGNAIESDPSTGLGMPINILGSSFQIFGDPNPSPSINNYFIKWYHGGGVNLIGNAFYVQHLRHDPKAPGCPEDPSLCVYGDIDFLNSGGLGPTQVFAAGNFSDRTDTPGPYVRWRGPAPAWRPSPPPPTSRREPRSWGR